VYIHQEGGTGDIIEISVAVLYVVFYQKLFDPIDRGIDLLRSRRKTQLKPELSLALRPQRQVVDDAIHHLFVGDRDIGLLVRADTGTAQTDLLHGAGDIVHFQDVAGFEGFVEEDHEGGDEVLDALLGGQGEGGAGQTQRGEDAGDIHVKGRVEDHQNSDDAEDRFEKIADKDDHLDIAEAAVFTALGTQHQGNEIHQSQQEPEKGGDQNDDGDRLDDGLGSDLID